MEQQGDVVFDPKDVSLQYKNETKGDYIEGTLTSSSAHVQMQHGDIVCCNRRRRLRPFPVKLD